MIKIVWFWMGGKIFVVVDVGNNDGEYCFLYVGIISYVYDIVGLVKVMLYVISVYFLLMFFFVDLIFQFSEIIEVCYCEVCCIFQVEYGFSDE